MTEISVAFINLLWGGGDITSALKAATNLTQPSQNPLPLDCLGPQTPCAEVIKCLFIEKSC